MMDQSSLIAYYRLELNRTEKTVKNNAVKLETLSEGEESRKLKIRNQGLEAKIQRLSSALEALYQGSYSSEAFSDLEEKYDGYVLGRNLDRICEEKNIKSKELAKLTGLQESAISLIRSGQSDVKLRMVKKISEALNVTSDELIYGYKPEHKDFKADTGLTEGAILQLQSLASQSQSSHEIQASVVSDFISSESFKKLVVSFSEVDRLLSLLFDATLYELPKVEDLPKGFPDVQEKCFTPEMQRLLNLEPLHRDLRLAIFESSEIVQDYLNEQYGSKKILDDATSYMEQAKSQWLTICRDVLQMGFANDFPKALEFFNSLCSMKNPGNK